MAAGRQGELADQGAATAAALVAAAKELLAERPPSAITGRHLARRAGVNYGLIHRHFGTKAAVLHRAFDELTEAYIADVFDETGLPGPLGMGRHPVFLRALTHVTMDRASFVRYRTSSPVVEHWLAGLRSLRPELTLDQVRALVAIGSSISLGVALHRRALAPAAGLDPDDPLIDELITRWLAGLRRGHGPLGSPPLGGEPPRRPAPLPDPPGSSGLRGRAAVEAQLVVTAAALLVDREPSAISGRLLAREAGVNYGLIHHYFGSKHEVLRLAVQHHRDRFFAEAGREGNGPEAFAVADHPGYVRAMTRASLDPGLAASQRYPVIEALLRSLTRADQPTELVEATRVAVVVAVSAQLAWALFTPIFEQGLGTDLRSLEPIAAPVIRNLLRRPLAD